MSNAFKGLPVIRSPPGFGEKSTKLKHKRAKNKEIIKNRGNLRIQCTSKAKDFYSNQTFSDFDSIPLASKKWDKKSLVGDKFKILKEVKKNPYINPEHYFKSFPIHDDIIRNLDALNLRKPTDIQLLSLPTILKGFNTMILGGTGSGKTHTYLIPIVQQILTSRGKKKEEDSEHSMPKSVIVVPTRELVEQTNDMANLLCTDLGINIKHETGGSRIMKRMHTQEPNHPDILIGSLGILCKAFYKGFYKTNHLMHIALDEIDSLLDDSYRGDLMYFLNLINLRQCLDHDSENPKFTGDSQLTMTGATTPQNYMTHLSQVLNSNSILTIKNDTLHTVPPHVDQMFLRVNKENRDATLLTKLRSIVKSNETAIVFCNTKEVCKYVSWFLTKQGINNGAIHKMVDRHNRRTFLKQFLRGDLSVLVCTDLLSRGVNTVTANYIINYQFPDYVSDYIHRCGRVGRIGSLGKCEILNFVMWFDAKLVSKIEYSIRKGELLPDVDANIKDQHDNSIQHKMMKINKFPNEENYNEDVRNA